MRRQVQVLCIAAAAVVAGGTLWAIASSDMLGRFGLSSSNQPTAASTERRVADVPARVTALSEAASGSKAAPMGGSSRSAEPLAIEIARIEAGNASVIAGRSPPNHRVAVIANGREIGSTTASDEGQWSVIISEGIAAGPLELSVKSMPKSGGATVASAPRHLVVPPSRAAEAVPAKAQPSSPTAAAPQARTPAARTASAPTEKPQPPVPPASASKTLVQVPSSAPARANPGPDKQALEQFAALVERARADAAAAAKRGEVPPAVGSPPVAQVPNAPVATRRASGQDAPTASAPPVASAVPAKTASAAGGSSAMSAGAADTVPDPAQVPIPVPITFVTDETEMTTDGARAASLLAEYLRLKRPEGISLSGHADSRGPDGYNMDLSRRRLEAIERYLRAAGYTGNLSLLPRGKREPYLGVDRTKLSLYEVYQADRRVELRMTQ